MNADQTYNSIAFKKSWDKPGSSERRASARGASIPDIMTVGNQGYVDSATKVAGKRYRVGFDYYELDSASRIIKSSAYVVITVAESASAGALTSNLATLRALVAASGILEAVVNGEL